MAICFVEDSRSASAVAGCDVPRIIISWIAFLLSLLSFPTRSGQEPCCSLFFFSLHGGAFSVVKSNCAPTPHPQEYIAFKNAQFSSFSVGAVRETYSRAFRSILALKRQLEMDHGERTVLQCSPVLSVPPARR